jgi:5-(aminomethyl)-3-furanmethanol phosphate kinase
LLFKGLKPHFEVCEGICELEKKDDSTVPLIWSPLIRELNKAGVAASWSVTSDSLAAWLAMQLKATELIIVKAAYISTQSLTALQQQGIIDDAFTAFAYNVSFSTHIVNAEVFCQLS